MEPVVVDSSIELKVIETMDSKSVALDSNIELEVKGRTETMELVVVDSNIELQEKGPSAETVHVELVRVD